MSSTMTLTHPLDVDGDVDLDPIVDLAPRPSSDATSRACGRQLGDVELPASRGLPTVDRAPRPRARGHRRGSHQGHADLADQLRRAAQSQPLNIAEGAGRTSRPDIAKHYTIARGSAMECAAILDVMRLQQTIKPQRYQRGVDLLTSVVAMLTKMI